MERENSVDLKVLDSLPENPDSIAGIQIQPWMQMASSWSKPDAGFVQGASINMKHEGKNM